MMQYSEFPLHLLWVRQIVACLIQQSASIIQMGMNCDEIQNTQIANSLLIYLYCPFTIKYVNWPVVFSSILGN